jgi:predicted house-cleaning noncanonical NTP pyrophosphatase (MazG superfamily)
MPKLIRDLIPEDMASHGYTPEIRVVRGAELARWLCQKLVEESREAGEATGADIRELGDVYGVLEALAKLNGFTMEQVLEEATLKRIRRGGFEKGYLWIDSDSTEGARREYAEAEYRKADPAAQPDGAERE